MNQSAKLINPIKPPIRINKNFVYNGKKYPIDFSLVKKYSNYFYTHRNQYKLIDDIELKPDNYEITEESIPIFIACLQNDPFKIDDTNIYSLYQLSSQYEVPVLCELTRQYIEENQKQLVFQIISHKLQSQNSQSNVDLTTEEDIISTNFFEYIDSEELISLPVEVLYRIINSETMKIDSMNLTNQGQFIDFLFRCLDKHKRKASVLFMNLSLEEERIGLLTKLLTEYLTVFDFNYINSELLAKNASFMLSEMYKLQNEMKSKIDAIEEENRKQREFFTNAQTEFNQSKSGLEEKVALLEQKVIQQQAQLERYTSVKVAEIAITNEPKCFLGPGSTMTLTASVKPITAFKDGVRWSILQEVDGTVSVESMSDKSLVLKCLMAKKVSVVASATDESGVTARMDLHFKPLRCTIEINVQQNQMIKGRIEVVEEEEGPKLDKSRSRYLLNERGDENLGESSYEGGFELNSLVKEVSFAKPRGDYFLHVLLVDSFGVSKEFVSEKLSTNDAQPLCFGYTGSVQPVELRPGSYKLEAWGAQGGCLDSTYIGGYGGYATGTINITSTTTLYVAVGKSTSNESGGYNGGGSGGVYSNSTYTFTSYGGGGSSHIGLKPGQLSAFSGDYSTSLLIVAGGGGGAVGSSQSYYNCSGSGGSGGGCTGANGNSAQFSSSVGYGATQSQGGKNNYGWDECGSFGQGSNCGKHPGYWEGGGGGGGFYGGGSGGKAGPGGGGSGYINASKLSDACMYGYNVPESASADTRTITTSNASPDAVSNSAKKNDGYVKITPI